MMTLQQLVSWLESRKGEGEWAKVAAASGVTYNTVSRIARGYMRNPSVLLVERLSSAIAASADSPCDSPLAAEGASVCAQGPAALSLINAADSQAA